ncbi:Fibroblast growth factor receptor [Holothuria leucospilota]|uniref:Fibroblast growth factor receptor n=1 Tax=Holothuria leucospilota TaxID=206669 RepID=A0A9Q0YSV1_HOLLE|nr:Fibroblast growth factor receptor [Holothuria leucospilota]
MRSTTYVGIWILLFLEKDHGGLSLTCEMDTASHRDVIFCSTAQQNFPEWCHCGNAEVDLSKSGTTVEIGRSLLIYYFSAAHKATISNCTAPRLGDICLCPAGLSDTEERKCRMCHSEGVSQMLCLTVDEYNHVIINDQNTDDAGCNITELCRDECEEVCGLTRDKIAPPHQKNMASENIQEIDLCLNQPCYNDGVCQPYFTTVVCDCKPPFTGLLCEKDPCNPNPCKNEGTCSLEHGSAEGFKCQCGLTFSGLTCEETSKDTEWRTIILISIIIFLVVVLIILALDKLLRAGSLATGRVRFLSTDLNRKQEYINFKGNNLFKHLALANEVDLLLKDKEVIHDEVVLCEKLGEGQFGFVYKGVLRGINRNNKGLTCAVKMPKVGVLDGAKEHLLSEMKLLADLGDHQNILSLLACCSRKEPYYLVTEFMKYGDLLTFLRECREKDNIDKDPTYYIDETKQVFIAYEITNGMAYIEEKRFYHGDLAARNILVGDNLRIKISDFGLAEDIYTRGYKRRAVEQKVPIKWCSLETILNGLCTSQGDVWSFGILLYEVFTLGGTPYPGIAARYLVSQLRKGYRMEQPQNCPDDIYELMLTCWREEPNNRPTFQAIKEQLDDMLVKRSDYLQFEQEDHIFNDTGEETEQLKRASYMSDISLQSFKYTCQKKQNEEGATAAVETFAPILDEENDIELTELESILHNEQ